MTLVDPRVSTAASLRTSARRRAMRSTPIESATADRLSGTAATARLIEVMNNSNGFVPRSNPSPNNNATMPKAVQTRIRPNASSLRCNGVP